MTILVSKEIRYIHLQQDPRRLTFANCARVTICSEPMYLGTSPRAVIYGTHIYDVGTVFRGITSFEVICGVTFCYLACIWSMGHTATIWRASE